MKKILLAAALTAVMFTGCANKATISCPSCTISTAEGYVCQDCTIEAELKKDMQFIEIPRRD